MVIRQLDGSGDWTFGKGLANYAQTDQAIAQNIQSRILSWVGDCFFDLQAGIDWKSRLDVGQQTDLEADIRTLLLQSYGVIGVNSLVAVFDPLTRGLSIQYNIDTIYSQSFAAALKQAAGTGS